MSVEIHTYGITHDCMKMEPASVSVVDYFKTYSTALIDSLLFLLLIAH